MSEIKVVRPDILDCLANLSSDEVFTPPTVVNKMLDLLPQELFESPKTKFLDPFTKSGVFLREIVKRLDKGLADEIPDKEKRIRHIFAHQVYGIAITQLTALFSRRSLYCNKDVNNERSTVRDCFKTEGGNIGYHPCRHTWVDGSCKVCGASKKALSQSADVENYAYPFLHDEVFMKQAQELGFDVVIGNPPYQMSDGGNGASAQPIYQKFVSQALKLNPKFLTMIIPSRWFSGGKGLDEFRELMLGSERIVKLVDYFDSEKCFPGVDISGGVCYFLMDQYRHSKCTVESHLGDNVTTVTRELVTGDKQKTFVRFNQAVDILAKISKVGEPSFSEWISPRKPFGLDTTVRGQRSGDIIYYENKNKGDGVSYINSTLVRENIQLVKSHKIFVSYAYGERGDFPYLVIGKPFYGKPGSCCSETYIAIGPVKSRECCENVMSYMKTKLFRFLVLLLKSTQHATKKVYQFVPMQDFSKPWTDAELYKKYKLTKEEIEFIESMIRPMDAEAKK